MQPVAQLVGRPIAQPAYGQADKRVPAQQRGKLASSCPQLTSLKRIMPIWGKISSSFFSSWVWRSKQMFASSSKAHNCFLKVGFSSLILEKPNACRRVRETHLAWWKRRHISLKECPLAHRLPSTHYSCCNIFSAVGDNTSADKLYFPDIFFFSSKRTNTNFGIEVNRQEAIAVQTNIKQGRWKGINNVLWCWWRSWWWSLIHTHTHNT